MKSVNKNHRSRVLAYILRHDKKTPIKQGGWLSVDYLISEKEFSSGDYPDCGVLLGLVDNQQLKNNYRISIYYH